MRTVGIFCCVAFVAMLVVGKSFLEPQKMSGLMQANVEALAEGEFSEHQRCYGNGSLTCYNGAKVAYIVEDFSLE